MTRIYAEQVSSEDAIKDYKPIGVYTPLFTQSRAGRKIEKWIGQNQPLKELCEIQ